MTGLLRFLQSVLAQRTTDLAIRQAELRQGYAIEKELAQKDICEREKPEPLKAENLASYRPSVLGTVPAYHSQPTRNSINPNAGVVQAFPNGRFA